MKMRIFILEISICFFDDLKFKKIDNIVLCDDSLHHDLYRRDYAYCQ